MYRVIVDTREVVIQKKLDQAWIDGYEFAGIANGVIIMKLRQDESDGDMTDEGTAAVLDEIVQKINDLDDAMYLNKREIAEGLEAAREHINTLTDRVAELEALVTRAAPGPESRD